MDSTQVAAQTEQTQIADESHAEIAHESQAEIADESQAEIAHESQTEITDEPQSQIEDQIGEEPHSQTAEKSVALTGEEPHSAIAGESDSQAAEELDAQIAEESLPQVGGADGSLDVMAEGLAAVLGPVVRDFDARVEGALKSQSLLAGSIDRLTRELDKLLEDTPIPMVAQHAAKLSGVRKRVASLMSTLRVIQGRIVNMDRMLTAREATASNPHPRASSSPSPLLPPENSVPQSPSPPPEILASPSTSSAPENAVPGSIEIRDSAS